MAALGCAAEPLWAHRRGAWGGKEPTRWAENETNDSIQQTLSKTESKDKENQARASLHLRMATSLLAYRPGGPLSTFKKMSYFGLCQPKTPRMAFFLAACLRTCVRSPF
jgi:hypothetical protein